MDLQSDKVVFDKRWASTNGMDAVQDLSSWLERVHPVDRQIVSGGLTRLAGSGIDSESATYRRKDCDGRWKWIRSFAGVSALCPDGRPSALSGVSFDVTEEQERWLRAQELQAELREDLQRAHQRDTVAQVAGGIAHELNNLLGLVLWNVERLQSCQPSDANFEESFDQMRRAIDMSRDLISGLGELGYAEKLRSQQDLNELIRSAVELVGAPRIERHALRVSLPDGVLPIWGNSTEILQVIVNLLINACDSGLQDRPAFVEIIAMPDGTVPPEHHPDAGGLASATEEVAVFQISDTGCGMTEDVRGRIFQRNFTTKGSQGTGLGLPIVARILQANKAALWVETAPDAGTTITIAWPTKPLAGDRTPSGSPCRATDLPSKIQPTALKGLQVLVVDDLPDVALVLASMLETAGAEVYCETDPEIAMECLADAPTDWSVLVTDLHMPGTDGVALARFVAALTRPIPVVLVTARPDILNTEHGVLFAAVLSKPISGAELVHAVRQAVDGQTG